MTSRQVEDTSAVRARRLLHDGARVTGEQDNRDDDARPTTWMTTRGPQYYDVRRPSDVRWSFAERKQPEW